MTLAAVALPFTLSRISGDSMGETYKRGTFVQITVQFTETEWADIHPWESIRAEAQIGDTGKPGTVEHDFTITTDAVNRIVLLEADTSTWGFGKYKWDILVVKGGKKKYYPPDRNEEITITEGVTE